MYKSVSQFNYAMEHFRTRTYFLEPILDHKQIRIVRNKR
jgi:hypothetical protein